MAEINGAGPEVVTLAVSAGGHIELHFVVFHYTCAASLPAKLATHPLYAQPYVRSPSHTLNISPSK